MPKHLFIMGVLISMEPRRKLLSNLNQKAEHLYVHPERCLFQFSETTVRWPGGMLEQPSTANLNLSPCQKKRFLYLGTLGHIHPHIIPQKSTE